MAEAGSARASAGLSVVILGSAQDGGVPQLGMKQSRGPERTASSIAVIGRAGGAALFDASPDLRRQHRTLLTEQDYRTRTAANVFDDVFLTHAHMGHYSGLVHFGREAHNAAGVACHGTESMHDFLARNEPWASLLRNGHLAWSEPDAESGWTLWNEVRVTALRVPHRAEHTDTVAYSIADLETGWSVLYLPDIDDWDAWPGHVGVIDSHDVALLDGTFFDDSEEVGRPLSDIPHPRVADSVRRFRHVSARVVFTHLNHTNPVTDPGSRQARALAEAGFDVAFDGMAFGS